VLALKIAGMGTAHYPLTCFFALRALETQGEAKSSGICPNRDGRRGLICFKVQKLTYSYLYILKISGLKIKFFSYGCRFFTKATLHPAKELDWQAVDMAMSHS
jgi:hypothetical protein